MRRISLAGDYLIERISHLSVIDQRPYHLKPPKFDVAGRGIIGTLHRNHLAMNQRSRLRNFLFQYWEWFVVAPIYVWLLYTQSAYEKPPFRIGVMWLGAILFTIFIRNFAAYRRTARELQHSQAVMRQFTAGSSVPPVMYQMNIQAHRIDKAVKEQYPSDVERVLLLGGYDGKIDDLQALVILKGAMGDKLAAPYQADPSGAWMLSEEERQILLRIRAIVWSYAMAIGDAHFKPPVIFSNANLSRLPE
jgi:hypothetical protein